MQALFHGTMFVAAFAVITDAQYSAQDFEELIHARPIYPDSYGAQRHDNYADAGGFYAKEEYQVRAKPVQLYVTYTRQGRRKKKGYGGYGWGKGGWWYYRDHKGCHSGTFGPPPGPGLEFEHYVKGACGSLGNHFKRVQGHGGNAHRNVGHGWQMRNQGWGQSNYGGLAYGQGKPHYGGLRTHQGGYGRYGEAYRRGLGRDSVFEYGNGNSYGY